MTLEAYQAWLQKAKRAYGGWRVDSIHNKPHDYLAYKGGETAGVYVTVERLRTGGVGVTLGTYVDAIPHIGDATFVVEGRSRVKDFTTALTRLGLGLPPAGKF